MRAFGRLFVVAALAACTSCERAEVAAGDLERKAHELEHEADREIDRAAQQVEELFRGSREDAQAALERRLEAVRAELEEAAARLRSSGEKAHDEMLVQLQAQRAEAERQLAELRAASEEQWRELCRETERATSELSERCRTLFDRR
jgi:hypothetical protein